MEDADEPPPLEPPPRARVVDPPPPLDGEPARGAARAASTARAHAPAPKGGAGGAGSMGLKKGFLSAGAPKPRAAAAAATLAASAKREEPEVIRPAQGLPSGALAGLRIDEVQDALKGAGAKLASNTEWVTDDLLAKMQADPILRQGLTNPRFQAVIAELQTDPQSAMARHAADGELQMFIMRFMQLMASHLSALAPAQRGGGDGGRAAGVVTRPADTAAEITPALSAEDRAAEELARKALADPQLRAVLEDADVQRVLQHVQARNVAPVEALMRRPDMVAKLQRLAGAGLLQMNWAH
ncbi:hypothetical protein KFE25_002693 [Diacronema lutheri]|uniref:STI1/HOP DP domain-containing protein n=1 Tax=Diacronema lutheri TaxID=2081491 RepID=A0A8J5XB70_DIALT|nr:hypothetical protein KFE25_002693 [Diacronema lutheri]